MRVKNVSRNGYGDPETRLCERDSHILGVQTIPLDKVERPCVCSRAMGGLFYCIRVGRVIGIAAQ